MAGEASPVLRPPGIQEMLLQQRVLLLDIGSIRQGEEEGL